MKKTNSISKLLATTAICTACLCINNAKADYLLTLNGNIAVKDIFPDDPGVTSLADVIMDISIYQSIDVSTSILTSTLGNKYAIDGTNEYYGARIENKGTYTPKNATFSHLILKNFLKTGSSNGAVLYITASGTVELTDVDFEDNTVENYGGAIYNKGLITTLSGKYKNNKALNGSGYGGAIFNDGTITEIKDSTFTGNEAKRGGVIYNKGIITDISGTFSENKAIEGSGYGGVIYNAGGTIVNAIDGIFTNNEAIRGGAINQYNGSAISIASTAVFKGNKAVTASGIGGAIYNDGTINILAGTFGGMKNGEGNSAHNGGAVYNTKTGTINTITANFYNNLATIDEGYAYGGAILNAKGGLIDTISNSIFKANRTKEGVEGWGGAIYSPGTINKIEDSTFEENYAERGAAVYVSGDGGLVKNMTGNNFINNHTVERGGAVYIYENARVENITNNVFTNNSTVEKGGALLNNRATIDNLSSNTFNGNSSDDIGGAIYNIGEIAKIENNIFTNNTAVSGHGGAIMNDYNTAEEYFLNRNSCDTWEEFATDKKGYNSLDEILTKYGYTSTDDLTSVDLLYLNTDDIAKTADAIRDKVASDAAKGGYESIEAYAIYKGHTAQTGRITFSGTNTFTNNKANGEYNDITNDAIITLANNAVLTSNGGIDGTKDTGVINFGTGSELKINNYLKGQTVNLNNSTITLGSYTQENGKTYGYMDLVGLNVGSSGATINAINNMTHSHYTGNTVISGNLIFNVDVDLAAKTMDSFSADTFTITSDGSITVNSFNIISDATGDVGTVTVVPFIVADSVNISGSISSAIKNVVNGDYVYGVAYNDETNSFEFTTKLTPEPTPGPTPGPEPTPAEEDAGTASAAVEGMAHAVVEAVYHQVLNRDIYETEGLNSGDAETLSTWVEVFNSKDDVKLKHVSGEVDAEFMGIVGGIDSKKFVYDNGASAIYGVYAAYTGSEQKYNGNKITQKGGYLGFTAAIRKDALFSHFTLNNGFIKNEANSVAGKDNFNTHVISIANKSGVDVKLNNGWTLTPAIYVAYTGIDTDNYTNKAGVEIENKFTNVITLAPELKLKKAFDNGFKSYAKLAYKFYSYDNEVKADGILLPEMSVKPYFEYGLGAEKEWTDHDATIYGEATRHQGGRTGWTINLGLKLDF